MKITYKYFFLLFFFFLGGVTFSQNSKIDSLKIKLQKHSEKDTTRVNLLNDLSNKLYGKRSFDKTIKYLKESEKISDSLGYTKGKAKSLRLKGLVYRDKSNFEKSLQFINEALQLSQAINSKSEIARCYNGIGVLFYYKGDKNKAIDYYKKAIHFFEEIGNKKAVAIITNNIGRAYSELGNYPDATIYYKKSMSIHKEVNNQIGVAYCYNNLGLIFMNKGNYIKALEHYNKSYKIAKKNADDWLVNATLGNIGAIYHYQEDYEKALFYYEKILETTDKKVKAFTLNNIGLVHKEKKNFQRAIENLKKSIKIHQDMNNKFNLISPLNNIGDVYLDLKEYSVAYQYFKQAKKNGLEVKNQRSLCNSYLGIAKVYLNQKEHYKALNNVLKSKKISDKLELLNYQRDAYNLFTKIYKATGKYKKALESHEQFKILNDSLFNKENIEKVAQLEYEYKYKQAIDSANIRELQLTKTVKATNENLEKSQRNLLLGVIAFLITTLILVGVIFFLKLRNEKSKTQNIVIEQKLLRSQMTPHFIFNSLSVLQGMILNKEEKNAISYLSKFSKLLRTILENSRHKIVVLSEELSAIDSYMALQNLDVSPPFEYKLTVDSKIDTINLKIPPMLIQPFIENVIEHAFPNKIENKQIKVTLMIKGEKLICTIEDNGIGIDEINQKLENNKNSLATTITSERLAMLSKEFKNEGAIEVQNRKIFGKEGTLVTLMIPYKIE